MFSMWLGLQYKQYTIGLAAGKAAMALYASGVGGEPTLIYDDLAPLYQGCSATLPIDS